MDIVQPHRVEGDQHRVGSREAEEGFVNAGMLSQLRAASTRETGQYQMDLPRVF